MSFNETGKRNRSKNCYACNGNLSLLPMGMPQSMRSDGLLTPEPLQKGQCEACALGMGLNSPLVVAFPIIQGKSIAESKRHKKLALGINNIIKQLHRSEERLNLLEVGAANFATSRYLKKLDGSYKITALEPYPEKICETNEINCIFEPFETASLERDYNIIFSNHVIEHNQCPKTFLSKCSDSLTEDGYLIVCCPTSKISHHELLFSDHFYHFSVLSMQLIGNSVGLNLMNAFTAHWDKFTHVFLFSKGNIRKKPTSHSSAVMWRGDTKRLCHSRKKYLWQWSNLDEKVFKIIGADDICLYGAGEFSQLIRTYLPKTYSKVHHIVVDDLNGTRKFDKKILAISELPIATARILIGASPSNANIMKNRALSLGIKEKNIYSVAEYLE